SALHPRCPPPSPLFPYTTLFRSIRGMPPALAAGFIMIELDVETGKWQILEYLGVADCGTVIHPMGLATQVKGGAVMGFGMAATEDRKSTRLNSSHVAISYAVFCL